MSKTYKQWASIWDSLECGKDDGSGYEGEHFNHVLGVLKAYSNSTHNIFDLVLSEMITSNFYSFFKGNWGRHHRKVVVDVTTWYYHPSGGEVADSSQKAFFTVEHVIASLKEKILKSRKSINPTGDLKKIFMLIKDKTGIDYDTINHTAVLSANYQAQDDIEKANADALTDFLQNHG